MPRRNSLSAIMLAIIACWFAPNVALAQSRDSLTVEGVWVGFPPAPVIKQFWTGESIYKVGAWAPVHVQLKCVRDYPGPADLVVEAPDCDEIPARYTSPCPQIPVGTSDVVVGLARPGGRDNTLVLSVVHRATGRILAGPTQFPTRQLEMEPAQFLFLSIGSKLDGARLPGMLVGVDEERILSSMRAQQARSLLASVTDLRQLPTTWFAYQGVNVAIVSTNDRAFMDVLVSERDGRKAALVDWVRRGGRLIVSAGINADQLANAGELKEILPVRIDGTAEVEINRFAWSDLSGDEPLGKMTVARCIPRPERAMKVLVAGPKASDGTELPLVISSSFGLGRVTVVAFDLDEKTLSKWKSRDAFWRELANRAGNRIGSDAISSSGVQYAPGRYSRHPEDDELSRLVQQMETFPGVPVISFGWVALFILIYIIIVGPLDYLFLKKVVKRLELTWITFPTIVLLVSAAAYYAAYALKGSDLRINKLDLVDIDLTSKMMTGRSWFTLFSPRIQNYKVGIEPNAPDWAREDAELDVLVGWAGQSRYNTRQSLFRRSYDYLPRATALDSVPVQVWSTKGFESQWFAPFDATKPLVTADLRRSPGGISRAPIGSITLNLPSALENAFLIDAANAREPMVRSLGTIAPGAAKAIPTQEPQQFTNWINSVSVGTWFPVKMFFHDLCGGRAGQGGNASLRDVDMSWRFNGACGDVAVLVGTLAPQEGPGSEIDKAPSNPSRLWLGAFPRTNAQWPKLDGVLKQATCVRIVIPIRSSGPAQP